MTPENMDRRVRKTRTTLRACLGKLLRTKKIQDISVRELADMADINRGTFYLHYRDVYDLLSQIESEVLKQFSELLDQHASLSLSDDPRPLLCDLFQLIRDNADLTRCLIGPNGDIQFLNRLRAIFNEKVITPSLRDQEPEGYRGLQLLVRLHQRGVPRHHQALARGRRRRPAGGNGGQVRQHDPRRVPGVHGA